MNINIALWRNLAGTSILCSTLLWAQPPDGPRGQGGPGGPGGRGGSVLLNALDTNHDGNLSPEEIAGAPRSLLKLDVNGDGIITPEELQPPPETAVASPTDLASQLMAFDRNNDGVLTADELPERLQPLFTRADTNHDGKVTAEELRALAARQTLPTGTQKLGNNNDPIFRAVDTNHDGTLSADEIANASKALLVLDKDHDGEISVAEMRPPQATPAEQAEHFLAENDTNKDGTVSKAEAPEFFAAQFEAVDKNHDGVLSRDELIAYFAANPAGRGGPGGRGPSGPGGGQRDGGDRPPDDNGLR